jgi:hypothetical protein
MPPRYATGPTVSASGRCHEPQRPARTHITARPTAHPGQANTQGPFRSTNTHRTYVGVGLIEEAAKLAALGLVAWRLPRYTMRDGIVFGAAVGFGFAALETAGYAFNAMFTMQGLSLESLVQTEILRGVLTPVGHGLWTAIVGGALFAAAASRGRLRLTGAVLGWYVLVALLHGLWDASRGIAVWLTLLLTATPVQWLMIELGRVPEPTAAQVQVFSFLSWGVLVLDALVGVAVLRGRWRRALAVERARPAPPTGPRP